MSQLEVEARSSESSLQSLWVEYVRPSLVALSLWEEEGHVYPHSLHPLLLLTNAICENVFEISWTKLQTEFNILLGKDIKMIPAKALIKQPWSGKATLKGKTKPEMDSS